MIIKRLKFYFNYKKRNKDDQILGEPTIYHALIIIFLEFFSWGLLTSPMITALNDTFPNHTFLMNGIVQGIKGLLSFFSAPMIGALSDVWGRKTFLFLTVFFTCSPIPLMKINPWWFFVLISLSGVLSVTFSIIFAYVSDITTEENRAISYGLVSATFAASLITSPAIGAYLEKAYDQNFVIALATLIALFDVIFILFFVPESLHYNVRVSNNNNNNTYQSNKSTLKHPVYHQRKYVDSHNTFKSSLPKINQSNLVKYDKENATDTKINHYYGQESESFLNYEIECTDERVVPKSKSLRASLTDSDILQTSTGVIPASLITWANADPLTHLRKIGKDRTILLLCTTIFFSYLPESGQYSSFFVYLKLIMNFSGEEVASFIAFVGILSVIAQTFILNLLMKFLGGKTTILVGLTFEILQLAWYGFASKMWMMWAAGALASLSSITYPAISSYVSNQTDPDKQGFVQGLITGIRGLCNGLGPALFGFIFYIFHVDLDTAKATSAFYMLNSEPAINGAKTAIKLTDLATLSMVNFSLPPKINSSQSILAAGVANASKLHFTAPLHNANNQSLSKFVRIENGSNIFFKAFNRSFPPLSPNNFIFNKLKSGGAAVGDIIPATLPQIFYTEYQQRILPGPPYVFGAFLVMFAFFLALLIPDSASPGSAKIFGSDYTYSRSTHSGLSNNVAPGVDLLSTTPHCHRQSTKKYSTTTTTRKDFLLLNKNPLSLTKYIQESQPFIS